MPRLGTQIAQKSRVDKKPRIPQPHEDKLDDDEDDAEEGLESEQEDDPSPAPSFADSLLQGWSWRCAQVQQALNDKYGNNTSKRQTSMRQRGKRVAKLTKGLGRELDTRRPRKRCRL